MTPSPVAACPETACPTRMVFGPCGGVEADGTCEPGDRRCVFLDLPTVPWGATPGTPAVPTAGAAAMRALLAARPVVVADLSVRAMSASSIAEVAGMRQGTVDAVLVGDVDLSGGAGPDGNGADAESIARLAERLGLG